MAFSARFSGLFLFAALAMPSVACTQSRPARAQDTAHEHVTHMRFGRNEVAAENVADDYRAKFLERHRTWGTDVRIADVDLVGLKMVGADEAEVGVKIAWYRIDTGDLHTTLVKQFWHDTKGTWRLRTEEHTDGAKGLWGEKAEAVEAPHGDAAAKKKPAQFPTYVLGQAKENEADGD